MSLPDRIETISVHIDPRSVPANAPIRKVPGEYHFDAKGVRIVNTEPIPDYFCGRCGMDDFYDSIIVGYPLDKAVLAKLEELGIDRPMQRALKESITTLERHPSFRVFDPQVSKVRSPKISPESSG